MRRVWHVCWQLCFETHGACVCPGELCVHIFLVHGVWYRVHIYVEVHVDSSCMRVYVKSVGACEPKCTSVRESVYVYVYAHVYVHAHVYVNVRMCTYM